MWYINHGEWSTRGPVGIISNGIWLNEVGTHFCDITSEGESHWRLREKKCTSYSFINEHVDIKKGVLIEIRNSHQNVKALETIISSWFHGLKRISGTVKWTRSRVFVFCFFFLCRFVFVSYSILSINKGFSLSKTRPGSVSPSKNIHKYTKAMTFKAQYLTSDIISVHRYIRRWRRDI